MNRSLFSGLTFLFLVQFSYGQETYLGIKIGLNNTTLNTDESSETLLESRMSHNLSFVYSYGLSQKTSLTFEPGWIKKGARINNDTLDYSFHYLNTPVLFDFYPLPKLKISLGPEVSCLTNATNRVSDTVTFNLLNTYHNRWEFSGLASISYSPFFFLDLGVRYSRSFTKISLYDPILDRRNLYTEYVQAFLVLKILN